MSEELPTQTTTTPQPKRVPEGYSSWNDYWTKEHNQPWRTESEIDEERQRYLAERRALPPDIERGIYPFKDIKLDRADVEWLLATHESGGKVGPVEWSDARQRQREGLDLRGACLQESNLTALPLTNLCGGMPLHLTPRSTRMQRRMSAAHLEHANLQNTHLEGAEMSRVYLNDADLRGTHFERAVLYAAHLEGVNLNYAHLDGADLRYAYFNDATYFYGTTLYSQMNGGVSVLDARWNGAILSAAILSDVRSLGDEVSASRPYSPAREIEDLYNIEPRTATVSDAVRANRQVAMLLRAQGLNEQADRFAYRSQQLQRRVNILQHRLLRYVGSLLLDLISGYGYKPLRSLITYIVIVCAFAGAYLINAQFAAPHLTWDEALVLSISAFHGRGFFTSGISLGDTLARLAAGEAVIGLLIEITFIATFTQRFFAR